MNEKQRLLLYWKAPHDWSIYINQHNQVVLSNVDNGIINDVIFGEETLISVIQKVMKTLGFKKKRGIVV